MISGRVTVRVVYDHFPTITANMRRNADAICAHFATLIEGGAKSRVVTQGLVDTGALLNSIAAQQVRPALWRVVVGMFYGVFHEFGTRFMPARAFLIPEFEARRAAIVDAFRTQLVTER